MCFYVLCIQIILLYVQIYLFNDSADWWDLFNWGRLPISSPPVFIIQQANSYTAIFLIREDTTVLGITGQVLFFRF